MWSVSEVYVKQGMSLLIPDSFFGKAAPAAGVKNAL
jgi:hypothetical protein